ncbi:uncharacterized protein LOC142884743 isoform X3 [Nelusetta ayraudi]|uniref:uncharacterized protein LOC142884743 isoform X3 n=1 Tax=Nelusetta ayraudi TaxID=303726 RepID=UPI003F71C4DB
MASSWDLIWVALLFACCFKSSDHRLQVHQVAPPNVNISLVDQTINAGETCTDNNALGLRREVSQLRAQLATCSAAASAITGSYHTQLQGKMSQLLNMLDSDASNVLKAIGLTREVNTLQKKLNHAANSTNVAIDVTALEGELEKQRVKLNRALLEIDGTLQNSSLILQVILLQNQIWDLEQQKQRGDNSPQLDKSIWAQQAQLDELLIQLRVHRDMTSIMLQLVSVQSKIAMTQRLIEVHIEESRAKKNTYQRQWMQLAELLKKKILQLSRDENNKELTMEIMDLQMEVQRLRELMSGTKTDIDTRLRELRSTLEELKKLQQNLQGQLEEEEYGQAQLLIKIINIMKEVRELDVSEQDHVTSQANTLQNLLQAKEQEYAKAQTEINEFKRKLRFRVVTGPEAEENLIQAKTDFEQEIARLNTTGDNEVALVLTLIKLQNELKALQELIILTDNPKRLSELLNLLEAKKNELNSKTEELERSATYHKPILRVIELQRKIWNLHDKGSNETNVKQGKELQNRVNSILSEIGSGGNTQTILRLLNLHSQIEGLQQQLSDLSMLQPTQQNVLRNILMLKKRELQTFIEELKARNPTNAQNVLTVTNLHNQLRNLQQEQQTGHRTPSSVVAELRMQLKAKERELAQDQARITALQNLLEEKESKCNTSRTEVGGTDAEAQYQDVRAEFERALAQLSRTRNGKAASRLTDLTLQDEIVDLTQMISGTADQDRISELQKQLEAKKKLLHSGQNRASDLVITLQLVTNISSLESQLEELQRQVSVQPSKDGRLTIEFENKQRQLQTAVNELNQKSHTHLPTILPVIHQYLQLRQLAVERQDSKSDFAAVNRRLHEQLRTTVLQQLQDQAQIKSLQQQLNQIETHCSVIEEDLKGIQTNLDDKMKELQSKSDSVTTLAVQVSTLSLQVEELNRQVEDSTSEATIKDLEGIIKIKNAELANRTEELKARSSQAGTFLRIVSVQLEINKQASVAQSEKDYGNISALQEHLKSLVAGIQDESNENTKLVFKIMAHQDEIVRLRKQEQSQTWAKLEKIEGLENELVDIRGQIKEKMLLLDSSDTRITNLSAQIMALHQQIKPLEDEISFLQEANANNTRDLELRLGLSKTQLQDSQIQLQEVDEKNFNLIKEITDLRKKLKTAREEGNNAESQKIWALEQTIATQQRENRRLENMNAEHSCKSSMSF